MRRSRKILGSVLFGLTVAANSPPASAATEDPASGYPFQECIETTFAHIRDISIKIGRFSTRTGIEIGNQSRRLAETFRDGGKEIWSAVTRNDDR